MQFQRTLLVFIVINASCSWNQSQTKTLRRRTTPAPERAEDERQIERLWAAALRAINEAELQRLAARPASFEPMPAPVRMNSKRLKWRANSKLLDARSASKQIQTERDEEQQEAQDSVEMQPRTYVSTVSNVQAPSYVDVSDHTPASPPWWF